MTSHQPAPLQRQADVVVVGGSAAGLAAALQLGRQRRSVIVVDAGQPRNAPAAHLHSYLGHEGLPPAALLDLAREEVRSYGGEILHGSVTQVRRLGEDRFEVHVGGPHTIVARHIVVATGLVDVLPEIAGLTERWGTDVIHCPFCHGYEARDRRIVLLLTHPVHLHVIPLYRQLTEQLTVVVHEPALADAPELAAVRAAGVEVVATVVTGVTGPAGGPLAVTLADGSALVADTVAIGTRFEVRLDPFAELGLVARPHPSGLGDALVVDPRGATDVAGVWAAGNVVDPSAQVLSAAAEGARVGGQLSFSLAEEDLASAARPSANEADWDQRYGGDRIWSGNPNGTLVDQVRGLVPGRALDVGAGEGGDALWLAEQGWTVTASDVSSAALAHVAAAAAARGLEVTGLHADANAVAPYPERSFDLVSAQYASIPRTPDGRGIANLLGAVAPGGTLVVVSHDLAPMRQPNTGPHPRMFDPDAYVRVEDVAAALVEAEHWEVELHETRPRPAGAASTHHVDDVVLRARYLGER